MLLTLYQLLTLWDERMEAEEKGTSKAPCYFFFLMQDKDKLLLLFLEKKSALILNIFIYNAEKF